MIGRQSPINGERFLDIGKHAVFLERLYLTVLRARRETGRMVG